MTTFAITGYEFSVFLHITAVVLGFGATFAESIMFPVAMKTSTRHLPYVHRLQLAINRYFVGPAMIIVLATGIYQVADADYIDFSDFWISASFAIVIAIGAINGAYFIPADRRLGAMVEREVQAAGAGEPRLSEEYQRAAKAEGVIGALTGLLVVIAIFLMVDKPGLG